MCAISALAQPVGLPADSYGAKDSAVLVNLGKKLFFDKRLSFDGKISCSSCHDPAKAFGDGRSVAVGIGGSSGTRNTPSLLNVRFATALFWDGRRERLETQAFDPLLNPREHGLANNSAVVAIVNSEAAYRSAFQKSFGDDRVSAQRIAAALASYQRTLLSGDSAFDRYFFRNEQNAMTAGAKRGLALFRGRAGCNACHVIGDHDALFTDNEFHSLGIGQKAIAADIAALATKVANADAAQLDVLIKSDKSISELGHFVVSKNPSDIGKFKTPSLRNVALTAPYMHDGSIGTLEDALNFELHWASRRRNYIVVVTPSEQRDLFEFLQALTSPAAALAGQ